MYREEIKLLDCSIRDGGLINKWQFSDEFVRSTIDQLNQAGVDYIEVGYKASKHQFDPKEYGKWRFCFDEDISKIVDGMELQSKLATMVDIGRVEDEDILPKAESPFSLIPSLDGTRGIIPYQRFSLPKPKANPGAPTMHAGPLYLQNLTCPPL